VVARPELVLSWSLRVISPQLAGAVASDPTPENGEVEFSQKVSATGEYKANVTNITHAAYGYTPDMDVDNPDFFSL
jgi:hypothetical protein